MVALPSSPAPSANPQSPQHSPCLYLHSSAHARPHSGPPLPPRLLLQAPPPHPPAWAEGKALPALQAPSLCPHPASPQEVQPRGLNLASSACPGVGTCLQDCHIPSARGRFPSAVCHHAQTYRGWAGGRGWSPLTGAWVSAGAHTCSPRQSGTVITPSDRRGDMLLPQSRTGSSHPLLPGQVEATRPPPSPTPQAGRPSGF